MHPAPTAQVRLACTRQMSTSHTRSRTIYTAHAAELDLLPPPSHPRVYLRGLPSRFRTHHSRVFIQRKPAPHHLHCDCTGRNAATTAAATRKHLVSFHAWCGHSACLRPFLHRMPRAESQRLNAKVSRVHRFAGWLPFPLSQSHSVTIYPSMVCHGLTTSYPTIYICTRKVGAW